MRFGALGAVYTFVALLCRPGESCDNACARYEYSDAGEGQEQGRGGGGSGGGPAVVHGKCVEHGLPALNVGCLVLQQHFDCPGGCAGATGTQLLLPQVIAVTHKPTTTSTNSFNPFSRRSMYTHVCFTSCHQAWHCLHKSTAQRPVHNLQYNQPNNAPPASTIALFVVHLTSSSPPLLLRPTFPQGACLYTTNPNTYSCGGQTPHQARLCPCAAK